MSLILSLPQDIVWDVFSSWINLRDWHALEIVVTCKPHKNRLLHYFHVFVYPRHDFIGRDHIDWIASCGIKLKIVAASTVSTHIDVSEVERLFLVESCDNIDFYAIINSCPKLKHIESSVVLDFDQLSPSLLKRLTTLYCFKIYCPIRMISEHCRNLKYLWFGSSEHHSFDPSYYISIVTNNPQLILLNLDSVVIDDEILTAISTFSINLTKLRLKDPNGLDIRILSERCRRLPFASLSIGPWLLYQTCSLRVEGNLTAERLEFVQLLARKGLRELTLRRVQNIRVDDLDFILSHSKGSLETVDCLNCGPVTRTELLELLTEKYKLVCTSNALVWA